MTTRAVWDVLKWVLLVLAAGFVGQFGRSLAVHLIERRRRKKAAAEGAPAPPVTPPEHEVERARVQAEAKTEKKRAKAQVKREKKAETDPARWDPGRSG